MLTDVSREVPTMPFPNKLNTNVIELACDAPCILPSTPQVRPRTLADLVTAIFVLAISASVGCGLQRDSDGEFPERPVKIVVPFGPGGGSDTFVRIIQKAINEQALLDQPVVIVNVPGAGATIGSRRVKNAVPDGYTILHLHDAIQTAKYAGVVPYGPEVFEAIAGTGRVGLLIAVFETAPYQTLADLMEVAEQKPDSVLFAANIGAPSHFAGLMLEQRKPGAKFRYTQTGGGSERFGALAGGHVDVSAFSTAEYKNFRTGARSGLRALAYFGEERHPGLPDIPTAREQGIDVLSSNIGYWWAPRGTPRDRLEVIGIALQKAMASPDVLRKLDELSIDPIMLRGEELHASLADKEDRLSTVVPKASYQLPNFPLFIVVVLVVLSIAVGFQSVRTADGNEPALVRRTLESDVAHRNVVRRVVVIGLLTVAYTSVLHLQVCDYRPATIIYVGLFGWQLVDHSRIHRLAVITAAFALGLGVHFAMTQFFFIDLP